VKLISAMAGGGDTGCVANSTGGALGSMQGYGGTHACGGGETDSTHAFGGGALVPDSTSVSGTLVPAPTHLRGAMGAGPTPHPGTGLQVWSNDAIVSFQFD
jgi:hypothetical protein